MKKLIILGTAGYHPSATRQTTCVVLPEDGIVLDAGTAFFRLPEHLRTDALDIFVSHAHLDHIVGLTYLLDVMQQHPLREVRVHGASEKLTAIREHLFAPSLFPVEPPYRECPLQAPVPCGEATVSYVPLRHPGGSLGYRIDWPDRSLAFITDTTAGPEAGYEAFVHGVDLLIHECNFDDGDESRAEQTGHSCLSPVAELAQRAGVGQLVLLHFNPLMDQLKAEHLEQARQRVGKLVLATDGCEITF